MFLVIYEQDLGTDYTEERELRTILSNEVIMHN